jgi:hypothetical protein
MVLSLGRVEYQMKETLAEVAYLSAVEIAENVVLSLVPRPVITGMIATAMPAAIRPYSMAVAADSSCKKAISFRRIAGL